MSDGWFDENEFVCPQCGFHDQHYRSWHRPGESLVTIIGFWPVEERDHLGHEDRWTARCHYRTACAHAHWDLQIIETPDQAIIPEGIEVIGVEEPYTIQLWDPPEGVAYPIAQPTDDIVELQAFEHPASATYIVGNTHYQRPGEHFRLDHKIGITMGDPEIAAYSAFYGSQIVPLIWYDRKLKGL